MKISLTRLANLEALIAPYRFDREFADKAKLSPSHLSQLRTGAKNLGENLARRIEARLGCPKDTWMNLWS